MSIFSLLFGVLLLINCHLVWQSFLARTLNNIFRHPYCGKAMNAVTVKAISDVIREWRNRDKNVLFETDSPYLDVQFLSPAGYLTNYAAVIHKNRFFKALMLKCNVIVK